MSAKRTIMPSSTQTNQEQLELSTATWTLGTDFSSNNRRYDMCDLKLLLGIVFMAFAGIATLWQPSTEKIGSPIGENNIHQMHVDHICRAYDTLRRFRPGLTSPPSLYSYLGVSRWSDTNALDLWRASASRVENHLGGDREPEREVLLQVSSVLLDESTRSVYDGTFWPAIEAAPHHLKTQKLRELCDWIEE